MLRLIKYSLTLASLLFTITVPAAELNIIDAHIHYSHDARSLLQPKAAIKILREAGLKKAMVSSSGDEGTQELYALAPDLIIPVLRPYRKRGETGTWMRDASIIDMLRDRLKKSSYAGIGEFHANGEDIELPVLQGVIGLAKEYGLFLHAHVDSAAIHRIFNRNPGALVLWAHSGFDNPDQIRPLLAQYPNLWADLAFRSDHVIEERLLDEWQRLFTEFPGRFVLGTDTYTPDRWFDVVDHADWSRGWLKFLPRSLAENIAYRNVETLLKKTRFDQTE